MSEMKKILLSLFLGLILVIPIAFSEEIVSIQPKEKSLCPCDFSAFDITINNPAEETETFNISIEGIPNYWYSLSEKSITIQPLSFKVVYLFVTAYCYDKPGIYNVTIRAMGEKAQGYGQITLNVKACRALKIEAPSFIQICKDEEQAMNLTIKNVGEEKEDIVLNFQGNGSKFTYAEETSFSLNPQEEKLVELKIKPTSIGEYTLLANVTSSSYARDEALIKIKVVECYKVSTEVPKEVKACLNVKDTFNVTVKNVGIKYDIYNLSIEGVPSDWLEYTKNFIIEPNKTKVIPISLIGKEVGKYNLTVKTFSESASDTDTIKLTIEKCYGVSITPESERIELLEYKGFLTRINITNIGTKEDSYSIQIEDTNWTSVKPSELSLKPNETGTVYVYFSPPFDVTGLFTFNLTVRSDYVEESKEIDVSIGKAVNITTTVTTTIPTMPMVETPLARTTKAIQTLWKTTVYRALLTAVVITLIIVLVVYFVLLR
jgi:hypothetical protein